MEYKYYLTINGYQLTTEPETVDTIVSKHGPVEKLETLGFRLVRDLSGICLEKRKEVTQVSRLSSDE